tara:strand:- start:5005 stop:6135 length:1131 start_codon:yes stop_codon:yes gene_type:complete
MGGAQQVALGIANNSPELGKKNLFITGLSNEERSDAPNNYLLQEVNKELKLEIIPDLNDKISLKNDFISLLKIFKILRKNKPELLHIHSSKTGVLGRLACIFLNTKVIFHVHGWSFSRSSDFKSKIYFFIEWLLYFFTDHFIFVCNQDRIDFKKKGNLKNLNSKSSVIYPGAKFIDLENFKRAKLHIRKSLSIDSQDIVVGNIARLDHQKDPELFVNIAKEIILKSDKKFKFVLIGSGLLEEKVKNMVEDLGIKDHFVFTGYIENVEHYFSIFDAFLITSKYEGLPVTALKAISCNSLIFGYKINGMKDLKNLFSTVFLVESRNPKIMADLILSKFQKYYLLKGNLESSSRKVRKEFNVDNMYNKIYSLYKNLIQK